MKKLCANIQPVNIPQFWYIDKYNIPQNRWIKLLSCYVKYSYCKENHSPSFHIFSQAETQELCKTAIKNATEFLGYVCCLPLIYEDDLWRFEDVNVRCASPLNISISDIVIRNKIDFLDVLEPYNKAHKLHYNGDYTASIEQSKRVFEVIFKNERGISEKEKKSVKVCLESISAFQYPKDTNFFDNHTLFTKLFLLKCRYANSDIAEYIPSDAHLYKICNLRHNQDHMNKRSRRKDADCEQESISLFHMANEMISLVFLDSSFNDVRLGNWWWKSETQMGR